ncbi:hypothetical protein AX15_006410 [Amanita polypyramis BW_CC]|nr:hypothetical protein AX15_006410 [Amanita polypyramis BW_CC]
MLYTLCRPLLRTAAPRISTTGIWALRQPAAFKPACPTPNTLVRLTGPILARSVASSVSGKPGSQTLEHAAKNIKEEMGNSAADLAKIIAASNVTRDPLGSKDAESFLGITRQVWNEVPKPMMVLGLMGGIPYLAASATTVYVAYEAGLAARGIVHHIDPAVALALLERALDFQVTYGAVLLSFLGAMHWGMEIAGYDGQKGYGRLALGAAPILIAWPTLAMHPINALIGQWLGFTALWLADAKVTLAGWTPKWYSQYRFYLSLLVGSCIIGSLAGTSFFGPVAGRGFLSHRLEELREQRKQLMPAWSGVIPGAIEAAPAGPEAEYFVRIHRKQQVEGNMSEALKCKTDDPK